MSQSTTIRVTKNFVEIVESWKSHDGEALEDILRSKLGLPLRNRSTERKGKTKNENNDTKKGPERDALAALTESIEDFIRE